MMREATIVLPNDLLGWALESLRVAYVLEASQFTFYDRSSEVVFCRSAVLPSIAFHHADVNEFFDLLVRRCAGHPGPTVESGLLFLSRRLIQSSRRGCAMLANTAEVEALAASMGFTVLSPEQFDWNQQVSLLARSRVVVGEHGSAMKSLLFAPSGTIGIVLNYLNESQAAIAALRGQRYVCLTADGYDAQHPQHAYSAEERKLRRVLEIALSQAPSQHIRES
jgi:capsular polysaccharide biosynthesis protein